MNEVHLVGRLTKDIELKYTQTKKAVASFSLAVRKNSTEADFINCTAWDKTAELLSRYTKKGSTIGINGRLQVDTYERDGRKRSEMKVVANSVEFYDKREQAAPAIDKFAPTDEPDPFEQEGLPF